MLRLIRAVHLRIDPEQGGRLCYGLANHFELGRRSLSLWVTLSGTVDRESGFIVNVCEIDDAFEAALGQEAYVAKDAYDILRISREILERQFSAHELFELKLEVNDELFLLERQDRKEMIQITKIYEICCAHRLHNEDWDDAKNKQVFGKCNNSDGHGHNYQIEITLGQKKLPDSGQFDLEMIDRVVDEKIMIPFDHRNLNTEAPQFATLNPTVENMTHIFWDILKGQFGPAQLIKVGIWETPKTYAEYDGS